MCGICGYISLKDNHNLDNHAINNMVNTMHHRGPDEDGYYKNNYVNFGMRRLIIIDKENGSQPIISKNNETVIIMNGEIFNYKELRNMLITNHNSKFRTNSDTEVLLEMYKNYGTQAIKYLDGMFSFAIYDNKKDLIWIARDRFGIKPLYYYYDDKQLIFGSTIDSIIESKKIKAKINNTSVQLYLLLSYVPSPLSIYNNIYKLLPGHEIFIKNKKIKIQKYWDINEYIDIKKDTDVNNKFENLLNSSVLKHSVSDQPVGTFLSGGLDSSVITKKYKSLNHNNFNSYTADFDNKKHDDSVFAKIVANKLDIKHHNYKINSNDFLPIIDELMEYIDEPVYDSAMVPSYILSKQAKDDNLKVLLAGNGADEILGGYKRHYNQFPDFLKGSCSSISEDVLNYLSKMKLLSFHKLLQLKYKFIGYAITFSGINLESYKILTKNCNFYTLEKQLSNYFSNNDNKNISNLKKLMIRDLKTYLVDNGLSILDKTTMATSIEGRVPYLDHKLVEYLISLDDSVYLSNNYKNSKSLLRNLAKKNNLKEITQRNKIGFNHPLNGVIDNNHNLNKIKKTILSAKHILNEFINYDQINIILDNYKKENNENIMNLYILATWVNNKCYQ